MRHRALVTSGCATIHRCIIVFILAGWLATDKVYACGEYLVSTVTDDKLNASSTYSIDYPAANARLNSTGWSPNNTEDDPWIQVDFGRPLTIVAVVTKGLNSKQYDEYVKKYKVRYSYEPFNWTTVYNGNTNEFEANSDKTTPVTNNLPTPIVARYLRLYPTECQSYRSLRFDVIGCEATTISTTLIVPTSTTSQTTFTAVKTQTTTTILSSSKIPTTSSTPTTTETFSSQVTSTTTNTPTLMTVLSSPTTVTTLRKPNTTNTFSPSTTATTSSKPTSTNSLYSQDTPTTSSKPATSTTLSLSTVSTTTTAFKSTSTITTVMSSPTTATTLSTPTTTNALSKPTTAIISSIPTTTTILSPHTRSTTFTGLSTPTISTTTFKSTIFNSTQDGLCTCTCTETNSTMTPQAVQAKIDNIVQNLTISKRKTSKYISSKTSAQDKRPEVVFVGSVAVAIICVFASLIVLPDLCTMIRFLYSVLKRKQRKKRKTLKDLIKWDKKSLSTNC